MMFEKIVLIAVPLFFVVLGFQFAFNSEWAYIWNIGQVSQFAEQVKNVPVLGYLAKSNLKFYKLVGLWYMRAWGVLAIIIGLANLYVILTQM